MPKLYQKLCLSNGARSEPCAPRYNVVVRMPMKIDRIDNTQIERYGESVLPCNRPKCDGTSSSRPIAYVTRAPVLMHESVVPISARNTVKASTSMNARPAE